MARQKGIIKLDGTIGDITFYKSQDGYLAGKKAGYPLTVSPMIRYFKEPVKTALSLVVPVKPVKFCVMQSVVCCKMHLTAGW